MGREKRYWVYMMASKSRVQYVGMSGFLMARVLQHKSGECKGFTRKYHVNRLVYYEVFRYVNNAIARETEIKKWRREKKVVLVEANNPTWEDLAADWANQRPWEKQIPHRLKPVRNDKSGNRSSQLPRTRSQPYHSGVIATAATLC